jgi:hypothetical protein
MDSINRLYGIYRAVVKTSKDPKNLRRIKVQSQTTGIEVTDWVWPVHSTAKPPSIGQGVFIMYQGGDPEFPLWIGEFGKTDLNKGLFAHGSFYSTQTQTTVGSEQKAMTFNNTDATATLGFSIVTNSQITAANTGIYNIAFSAQLRKTSGGGATQIYIWIKTIKTTISTFIP